MSARALPLAFNFFLFRATRIVRWTAADGAGREGIAEGVGILGFVSVISLGGTCDSHSIIALSSDVDTGNGSETSSSLLFVSLSLWAILLLDWG